MRIALVVHHELVGATGAAGSTLTLAEGLRSRGHQVDVVGTEIVGRGPARLTALRFPSAVARWMRRAEREGRYDLIDASTGDAARLTRREVSSWRTVLVTRSHGLEALGVAARRAGAQRGELVLRRRYGLYHAGWRLSEVRRSLQVADAVAVLNDEESSWVCGHADVPPDHVFRTAPLAGRSFNHGEADATIEFAVLVTGGLEWRKGSRDALAALARVIQDYPELRITWLGANPRDLESLDARLASRVTTLSSVSGEDMVSLYQQHSVLLHLSRFEGFGLTVLEAASHGLSIVATDIAGPRDIVGEAGILVPVADVDAVVVALRELAAPSRRALWGAAAHLASRRFAPDRVVTLLESNYQSAIGEKARVRQ